MHKTALADAKKTARDELEGEAAAKVNFVMRQAAAEIKTKVGEAEARTQQAVDRAVAEAVAATRRQADAERREALAAAEVEWGKKLAVVQAQSVSGVGMKIARVQEGQQERVQHAVPRGRRDAQTPPRSGEASGEGGDGESGCRHRSAARPRGDEAREAARGGGEGKCCLRGGAARDGDRIRGEAGRDRGAAELRAAVGAARAEAGARACRRRGWRRRSNRIREAVTAREKELLADHGRACRSSRRGFRAGQGEPCTRDYGVRAVGGGQRGL